MKSNPFYALSACAMLLGCWLLSEALHLQPGQLIRVLSLPALIEAKEHMARPKDLAALPVLRATLAEQQRRP